MKPLFCRYHSFIFVPLLVPAIVSVAVPLTPGSFHPCSQILHKAPLVAAMPSNRSELLKAFDPGDPVQVTAGHWRLQDIIVHSDPPGRYHLQIEVLSRYQKLGPYHVLNWLAENSDKSLLLRESEMLYVPSSTPTQLVKGIMKLPCDAIINAAVDNIYKRSGIEPSDVGLRMKFVPRDGELPSETIAHLRLQGMFPVRTKGLGQFELLTGSAFAIDYWEHAMAAFLLPKTFLYGINILTEFYLLVIQNSRVFHQPIHEIAQNELEALNTIVEGVSSFENRLNARSPVERQLPSLQDASKQFEKRIPPSSERHAMLSEIQRIAKDIEMRNPGAARYRIDFSQVRVLMRQYASLLFGEGSSHH